MTEDVISIMPRAIERGMLSIRSLVSCEVEQVPRYDASAKQWIFSLWLNIEHAGAFVNTRTKWCVLIDETYPYGRVTFYPAVDGGLMFSFPHQARNTLEPENKEWRLGKLCLDSPFHGNRHKTIVRDPVGDAEGRLRWHVERALTWLSAAASGQLLAPGDPFETPSQPLTKKKDWADMRLVYDESAHEFDVWTRHRGAVGTAEFGAIPGIEKALAIGAFVDGKGVTIRIWKGRPLTAPEKYVSGIWWLWPQPIVVPPWQAPISWGELRKAGNLMGIDVDVILAHFAPSLRGKKNDTILLLGYPMPARIGSTPTEIHWDAIILPRLAAAVGNPPKGFRPNACGWWQRDHYESFADKEPLVYLRSENWSGDRLQARGRLPSQLRDAHIVMLGVGALGSTLAELMVRAGLSNIALVDDNLLVAGNICRHIATLVDIGHTKVDVVARRLRQISPFVSVSEIGKELPADVDAMGDMLEPYDVIVDCTGSDDALSMLARGWWSIPRIFASFSLGFGARRLFSFGVTGHFFPLDRFSNDIEPWLLDETSRWAVNGELLEGPGCWSPLFPARYDDVMIAASVCVKELEAMAIHRPRDPRFLVFEQSKSNDGFIRFSSVRRPRIEDIAAP